jgi:hypothetical protein
VLLLSSSVFAGGSSTIGKISNLYFMKNGALLFSQSGSRTNPSTDDDCVLAQSSEWAIDGSTDFGKTQISGLLMAYSMEKEIVVHGLGDCLDTVHNTRETVDYFYMD